MTNDAEQKWIKDQIRKHRNVLNRYKQMSQVLEDVLRNAAKKYAPLAIVQVRTKSISSFAEKIQRKGKDLEDPVTEFTDLCGGRVITNTSSEVRAICKFIEDNFDIDWENSIDVSQRHKPTEFGYRSVHYIISFKKDGALSNYLNVQIPRSTCPTKSCPMKAEVQVRTLLEHSWAVFSHDRTYKSSFELPDKWKRELASVAALLEDADKSFERVEAGLKTYASSYQSYMTEEQIRHEIDKLEFVLSQDSKNVILAARIGQLASSIDDWDGAIKILRPFEGSSYQPALKVLGFALTKKFGKSPRGRNFKNGQKYLEAAIDLNKNDVDALSILAGTWKKTNEEKACDLYRRAFELDPADPYPLVNYLTCEIVKNKHLSIAHILSPIMEESIRRCEEQAEVGVNIPWAYYSMGKLYLLLQRPYDSVAAYARAIQLSTAEFMIESSLKSLERLSSLRDSIEGYEWVRRLLIIGRAAKFPNNSPRGLIKRLSTPGSEVIKGPVLIVAGGCDGSVQEKMHSYRLLLKTAFKDFQGTVISGGTREGISGLMGDVKREHEDSIHTIGYLPEMIPSDATIDRDRRRYSEIRRTAGDGFTPLEPLQNWIDILASGIDPKTVKVLGINGGKISAAEYKMALAFGAKVAIIENSGREATKLLNNPFWKSSTGLLCVPADAQTLKVFVRSGSYRLPDNNRTSIAKAFHEVYQENTKEKWSDLKEEFKESNLQAADHIMEKLQSVGYEMKEANGKVKLKKFLETERTNEVEIMAEMEHGRWNIERLSDGWRWGEKKNVDNKINPNLVSWLDLPDEEKKKDIDMVRMIPEILASLGYEIRRIRKERKRGRSKALKQRNA